MARFVGRALVALLLLAAVRSDLRAQGIGFQGGIGFDPTQVYVGTHFESAAVAERIFLRPGIDGAFGSGVQDALVDLMIVYRFQLGARSPWSMYQGTGPLVTLQRVNDAVHPHGGLGAVFGFAHVRGPFVEFKVSGGGGPSLRLGIGYTVRRQP